VDALKPLSDLRDSFIHESHRLLVIEDENKATISFEGKIICSDLISIIRILEESR
jgi:hypothetical protein